MTTSVRKHELPTIQVNSLNLLESSPTSMFPLHNLQQKSIKARGSDFNAPACELFVWALMFHRLDMARFYWRIVPDPIGEFSRFT
jgi:hypothetical protein